MEVSCKLKCACSAEKGARSFEVLPEIGGRMSRMVSSWIFVNFCNSCPRSFTVAPEFIFTTNFFPLQVTEISSRLGGVSMFDLHESNMSSHFATDYTVGGTNNAPKWLYSSLAFVLMRVLVVLVLYTSPSDWLLTGWYFAMHPNE